MLYFILFFFFFFFFQAEDGIRDLTVTGVQTCALPIFSLAVLGMISTANAATIGQYEQTPTGIPELQIRYDHGAGTLTAVNGATGDEGGDIRSEEHTSELQSQSNLVCRLLLEKKKKNKK